MKDIKAIPMHELVKDLNESHKDIKACKDALLIGVFEYSGGLVRERLRHNKNFVKVITAEIERRRYGGGDTNDDN